MKTTIATALIAGCALLLWLAPAMASDYIPLYVGYDAWFERDDVPDEFFHWWIDAVDGEVFSLHRARLLADGTQNFYQVWSLSRSEEDDVLFHGGFFGSWVELDPPLPLVDAPLFVGKRWDNTVEAPVGEVRIQAMCSAEEDLVIDGQSLHCFAVEYTLLHGQTVYSSGTLWLVDDVGLVKAQHGAAVYVIVAPVVGTRATSWTGIKALFD